jgi:hypothetical protein
LGTWAILFATLLPTSVFVFNHQHWDSATDIYENHIFQARIPLSDCIDERFPPNVRDRGCLPHLFSPGEPDEIIDSANDMDRVRLFGIQTLDQFIDRDSLDLANVSDKFLQYYAHRRAYCCEWKLVVAYRP